jgi:hypothetical protein
VQAQQQARRPAIGADAIGIAGQHLDDRGDIEQDQGGFVIGDFWVLHDALHGNEQLFQLYQLCRVGGAGLRNPWLAGI